MPQIVFQKVGYWLDLQDECKLNGWVKKMIDGHHHMSLKSVPVDTDWPLWGWSDADWAYTLL